MCTSNVKYRNSILEGNIYALPITSEFLVCQFFNQQYSSFSLISDEIFKDVVLTSFWFKLEINPFDNGITIVGRTGNLWALMCSLGYLEHILHMHDSYIAIILLIPPELIFYKTPKRVSPQKSLMFAPILLKFQCYGVIHDTKTGFPDLEKNSIWFYSHFSDSR